MRGDLANVFRFQKLDFVRKDRRGVSIASHAQDHQVEFGNASIVVRNVSLNFLLVTGSLVGWIRFAMNTMNVCLRYGNMIEQQLFGHRVIAVAIFRRHASLIAPEEVNATPVDLVREIFGKLLKEQLWSAAAGQRHRQLCLVCGLACRPIAKVVGKLCCYGWIVGENFTVECSHRNLQIIKKCLCRR